MGTCSMRIARDGVVEGFVGYFDAFFRGSPQISVEQEVTLSTAPMVGSSTHWGQQIFGFYPPLHACRGDCLEGSMYIRRTETLACCGSRRRSSFTDSRLMGSALP